MASSVSTWTCSHCTFVNDEGSDERKCCMCHGLRIGSDIRTDAAVAGTEGESSQDIHQREMLHEDSIRFSDLIPSASAPEARGRTSRTARDSMFALGNMSFAAWESDRTSWQCRACTFVNEPRFLMCGACGLSEGTAGIDLNLSGLKRMSLNEAQNFLMKAVQKELDSEKEGLLRHKHAVEVLEHSIKTEFDYAAFEKYLGSESNDHVQKESSTLSNARRHIENLQRIQQAEKEEHKAILLTLEKWRATLREETNHEQERQLHKQEKLLNRQLKEWDDRETELKKLRMKLDGNSTAV